MKGRLEFYIEKGISLDEYVDMVGLRTLIKEKKLKTVLEVFIEDEYQRKKKYNQLKKRYFMMRPLNFQKLLPFE